MPSNFGKYTQTIQNKTADYTAVPGDDAIVVTATTPVTITLYTPIGNFPQGSQLANVGDVTVINSSASLAQVVVATAAGSIVGQTMLGPGQAARYLSDGVGNWYVFSPLTNSIERQVAISSADILALSATPKSLIPAPGAGKVIVVEHILLKMVTTATQYANGGALEFRYTDASGAKVSADIAAAVITAAAATSYTSVAGVTTSLTNVANSPLILVNATAPFITGTGTAVVSLKYRILTP